MKARRTRKATTIRRRHPAWNLRLYVAGSTLKSAAAYRKLEQICEEHLAGRYHIEVVDLRKNPQIARDDQILAVPTVIRKSPSPIRKIIGDLSNTDRVVFGLDLPLCVREREKNG